MQTARSAGFAIERLRKLPVQDVRQAGRHIRLVLVGCAALFIVMGPAAGQMFGWHSRYLREWVMFSGGGIGVLKGRFTLHRDDGTVSQMSPLETLGLERYPSPLPDTFDHLILEDRDLRGFASRLCDHPAGIARLSFHGLVGTRQGWRPLEVANVCALPRPAASDDARAGNHP